MEQVVAYYEQQSTALFGRDIPPGPADPCQRAQRPYASTCWRRMLERRGYTFMPLDEAHRRPGLSIARHLRRAGRHRAGSTGGRSPPDERRRSSTVSRPCRSGWSLQLRLRRSERSRGLGCAGPGPRTDSTANRWIRDGRSGSGIQSFCALGISWLDLLNLLLPELLLVVQRLDRIEAGGARGGIEAENQADARPTPRTPARSSVVVTMVDQPAR